MGQGERRLKIRIPHRFIDGRVFSMLLAEFGIGRDDLASDMRRTDEPDGSGIFEIERESSKSNHFELLEPVLVQAGVPFDRITNGVEARYCRPANADGEYGFDYVLKINEDGEAYVPVTLKDMRDETRLDDLYADLKRPAGSPLEKWASGKLAPIKQPAPTGPGR